MIDPLPADGRPAPQAIVIGQATGPEFATLVDRVLTLLGQDKIEVRGSIESLLTDQSSSDTVRDADLLIVLHSWPEQYTRKQVFDLLDRYPLARLIVCFGCWCDSDGRTRDVWPAAARVPVAQAESRLHQELAVLRGAADPLPLTASRDEAYECDYREAPRTRLANLSIELRSPDPAIRDWLAELLHSADGSVHTTPQDSVDLAVWDVDPWCAATAEEVIACRQQRLGLSIVALAGFARVDEVRQMRQCGIASVVPKTSPGEELLNVIQSLSDASAQRRTSTESPTVFTVYS